ncbi:MAG TPA: hypothetical protein VE441_12865 [Mycobacterium sp.]|nr:hypothetical protein [Mycobacterium sp.]
MHRYELHVDGRVSQTYQFTLRPDQRRQFTVASHSSARVEMLLYTGNRTNPYRQLVVTP